VHSLSGYYIIVDRASLRCLANVELLTILLVEDRNVISQKTYQTYLVSKFLEPQISPLVYFIAIAWKKQHIRFGFNICDSSCPIIRRAPSKTLNTQLKTGSLNYS
jgi:hypothetical protein